MHQTKTRAHACGGARVRRTREKQKGGELVPPPPSPPSPRHKRRGAAPTGRRGEASAGGASGGRTHARARVGRRRQRRHRPDELVDAPLERHADVRELGRRRRGRAARRRRRRRGDRRRAPQVLHGAGVEALDEPTPTKTQHRDRCGAGDGSERDARPATRRTIATRHRDGVLPRAPDAGSHSRHRAVLTRDGEGPSRATASDRRADHVGRNRPLPPAARAARGTASGETVPTLLPPPSRRRAPRGLSTDRP